MPTIKDTKLRPGAHIAFEQELISRENVTITGGSYTVATVVGKITANGKYTQVNAAATDGSENAAAVLFRDVDASAGDAAGVVNDCHSVLKASVLVWPDGATQGQKDGWIANLRAAGIKVR